MHVRDIAKRTLQRGVNSVLALADLEVRKVRPHKVYPEITDDDLALLNRFADFTLSGVERQWTLLKAIRHVDASRVPGDIVECGVWRGGNVMLAKAARQASAVDRRYFLFDTFAGMTKPEAIDKSYDGHDTVGYFETQQRGDHNEWVYCSQSDVERNFASLELLDDSVKFCKGDVVETLAVAANLPQQIAILRLDTDWYASTRKELEVLYPLLAPGGVLIVDDYGHYEGARRAVDEYFADGGPLLIPVDYTCRMGVKPA